MPENDPDDLHDEPADAVSDPRDRRKGERRDAADAPPTGDRRKTDRRRSVDVPEEYRGRTRSINEYPLQSDELEFINAINAYKSAYNKPFPTWSEVLHILKSLGYRKGRGGDDGDAA